MYHKLPFMHSTTNFLCPVPWRFCRQPHGVTWLLLLWRAGLRDLQRLHRRCKSTRVTSPGWSASERLQAMSESASRKCMASASLSCSGAYHRARCGGRHVAARLLRAGCGCWRTVGGQYVKARADSEHQEKPTIMQCAVRQAAAQARSSS